MFSEGRGNPKKVARNGKSVRGSDDLSSSRNHTPGDAYSNGVVIKGSRDESYRYSGQNNGKLPTLGSPVPAVTGRNTQVVGIRLHVLSLRETNGTLRSNVSELQTLATRESFSAEQRTQLNQIEETQEFFFLF